MRVVRLRRGARIVEGRDVLSEILARPGATDSLFDVLAACVAALATGPRVALLGFAGGGVVAPLRAMGLRTRLEAVDLSRQGEALFRELSESWAGEVHLTKAEASNWLRRHPARWDVILEDLSMRGRRNAVKPRVSLDVLPELIARRLAPRGVVVVNVLPMPGTSWRVLLKGLAAPFPSALVITLEDYENRILIAGRRLGNAREISHRIRRTLLGVGSTQARTWRVRTLR
jgi:hypothetical protein